MNEPLTTLKTRRSIRRYRPEQVRPETLDTILEAGTYAPSGMGKQSAVMVVVQKPDTIALLSRLNAEIQGRPGTDPFYGAPTVVVVLADGENYNWMRDGALVMGNLMNAASCVGFGHWGNHAYLLQYVSRQNPGFFMNNELSHLYNLASVFSERLDTPQALLLAGESYRSIYEMLSNQTPSGRNGKKGFTDYSQAYPRLGIPVSLVSCDDTGAMQLAIMRQMDYRTRIAQAAFGARWKPEDDRLPEADGHVDGNPLVIAVDMDLRRLERVCRDACQQGRREILVAALEGQMSGLLLDQFPRRAPVRALRINTQVLAAAFGENFSAGDPWPNEPLRWKGGLIHV